MLQLLVSNMKRRKLLISYISFQMGALVFFATFLMPTQTAIVPPPWSDPEKNPCASMPGGWQLLYWPPLKQCFKIFTIGYPCPDTMELSPTAVSAKLKESRNAPAAECRCPPETALGVLTNKCHKLFERGPCEKHEFFSPMREIPTGSERIVNRWGVCKKIRECPESMIFWPKDGKCYMKFSKGPCAKGKLLTLNSDGFGSCKCENKDDLQKYFYEPEGTCHEHYTKGPCTTPGQLFLPGGRCNCHRSLPHYHEMYQMCFELNSPGPCPPGHIFSIPDNLTLTTESNLPKAQCQCKDNYILWKDGICYRLYTRGPCGPNEFLINATTCIHNFCGKSRLYFPDQKSCYRIGTQGPCALHQIVIFDFTTRPSIDGISYNGICGCSGVITSLDQKCTSMENDLETNTCESTPGMVELNGNCYKLYTRGPCGPGQWLEPLKTNFEILRPITDKAKCVCRPGFTLAENIVMAGVNVQRCNAPNIGLARYLTMYQRSNSKSAVTLNFQDFQFQK